jgi:hypothetical protein
MQKKDFYPTIVKLTTKHLKHTEQKLQETLPHKQFSFKSEALDWFRNYQELAKEVTTFFTAAGIRRKKLPVSLKKQATHKKLVKKLTKFYNGVVQDLQSEGADIELMDVDEDEDDDDDDDDDDNDDNDDDDDNDGKDDEEDQDGEHEQHEGGVREHGDQDNDDILGQKTSSSDNDDEQEDDESIQVRQHDVGEDVEVVGQGHVIADDGERDSDGDKKKPAKKQKQDPAEKGTGGRRRNTHAKKKIGTVVLRKQHAEEQLKKKSGRRKKVYEV